jgi:8-oxo-dGTP diphosphatase
MLHCAVGIVKSPNNQILISQRPLHKIGGGFWEFPGGKVEDNETTTEALIRELKEEVGIIPVSFQELIKFPYQYPSYSVLLDVFLVDRFEGNPPDNGQGLEGQTIAWVEVHKLPEYHFLEANSKVIEQLNLRISAI